MMKYYVQKKPGGERKLDRRHKGTSVRKSLWYKNERPFYPIGNKGPGNNFRAYDSFMLDRCLWCHAEDVLFESGGPTDGYLPGREGGTSSVRGERKVAAIGENYEGGDWTEDCEKRAVFWI